MECMESELAGKIYDKMMDISTSVGRIQGSVDKLQGDIDTIRLEVQRNYTRSEEMDAAFASKLEEYFSLAKKRQDSIKQELEGKIDAHDVRISALEGKKAATLVRWYDRLRDWVLWGALTGGVTLLVMQVKKLAQAIFVLLHQLPPPPPGAGA